MNIPRDPPDEPKSAQDMIEHLEKWSNVDQVKGPIGIPDQLKIEHNIAIDRDNIEAIEWAGWKIDLITKDGIWIKKNE